LRPSIARSLHMHVPCEYAYMYRRIGPLRAYTLYMDDISAIVRTMGAACPAIQLLAGGASRRRVRESFRRRRSFTDRRPSLRRAEEYAVRRYLKWVTSHRALVIGVTLALTLFLGYRIAALHVIIDSKNMV